MSVAVEAAPIQRGFWSGVGNAAKTVGIAIKDAAVWCGRMIKVLFTDYIVPAMKKIWPMIVEGLKRLWSFIKTAPGLGTLGCIIGIGAGFGLLALAKRDSIKDKTVARIALITLASLAFIASAAALGAGIAFGVM